MAFGNAAGSINDDFGAYPSFTFGDGDIIVDDWYSPFAGFGHGEIGSVNVGWPAR